MTEGNEEPLEFFCSVLVKNMRAHGAIDDDLSAGMFMRLGVALAMEQPEWCKGYLAIYLAAIGPFDPEPFEELTKAYPIEDQGKPHIDLDVN